MMTRTVDPMFEIPGSHRIDYALIAVGVVAAVTGILFLLLT